MEIVFGIKNSEMVRRYNELTEVVPRFKWICDRPFDCSLQPQVLNILSDREKEARWLRLLEESENK